MSTNELKEKKSELLKKSSKDRYWKIPICYDDDEDDTIAITPVLPIEEPDNSLSMGDEHLDTIPSKETTEFHKVNFEDLVPTQIVVNSNDDNSSSDDDSTYGEDIDYVDASPPDVEIVSLEVVEIVTRNNPTPSFRSCINSTPHFLIILEETYTFDNSIPESENFRFNLEEISSGSPTTHSESDLYHEEFADELTHIMSLPNLECFKFKIEPDPGDLTSIPLLRKIASTLCE
ncbi:hypothetical protein Tco_0145090 [Tanacetum coccineum]